MLKVDATLNHIPARREHVIALYASMNQPMVNIPNSGAASTGAFILGTRNDQGSYMAFVYLYQPETRAVMIYASEVRALRHDQYRVEEAEAIRFVESMGFMVDNTHFPTLPPHEQDALMTRVPLFRPPEAPPLELVEVADSGADMFGGFSHADNELFRRAGFQSPQRPASGLSPVPVGLPQSSPQAGRPGSGIGPTSMAGAGFEPHPQMNSGPPPPLSAESLERLGRFLALFTFLGFVVSAWSCTTTGKAPIDQQGIESHVDLGNQQLANRQWRESIRTFQTVLEQEEEHRDALRGMGLAYMNLGRLEEAERYYAQSIEVDKAWSIPKNELAVVFLRQKRCQDAESLLKEVLKDIFYMTPEYAEHNLAQAEDCQGRTGEAIQRLSNLVLKRPNFCLGYLTLADLASNSQQYEKTIEACDDFVHHCEQNKQNKAHVLPEHSNKCYLKKGMAYAKLGDVESARASFRRCQSTGSSGPYGRECQRSLRLLPP